MSKDTTYKLLLCGTILASGFAGIAVPATAQEEVAAFEEIVVTARKRGTESLQDLPGSIAALGGNTLEKMGVADFEDFAYQVPGLTFTDSGAGEKRYIIRGIQSAGQQQVAVYYDEVPLPGVQDSSSDSGSQTTDLKIYDMERVEVLRGPQGTVFGANSQTGTVRFITKKPVLDEFEGSFRGELSSTAKAGGLNWGAFSMFNAPIVENKLGVRLVAYADRLGGYIDNKRLNLEDINWSETKGVRASLRFEPTDALTLDAQIWHQTRDTGGDARYHPYDTYNQDPSDTDNPGHLDNVAPSSFFQTGEFIVGDYTQTAIPDSQTIYSLTANWDLGWADLVATGSYYERDFGFKFDSTWIVLFLGAEGVRDDLYPALTDQNQSLEQKNFEIRLNSKTDGPLQWLAGAFYRKRDSEFQSYVPVTNEDGLTFDPGTPYTGPSNEVGAGIEGCHPCVFAREATKEIEELAFFGEVSYAITEKLEATVGLRWFQVEQADFGQTVFQFALFGSEVPPPNTQNAKEDKLIKKFHLGYTVNDDITLYAVASEGFRLGGTNNQGIAEVPPLYESDQIWNYEIGAKTSWMDDRLRINASAFHIDWTNLQVAGQDPTGAFGFVGNAGAAQVQGLELEVFSRPDEHWDLSAGLSWLPKRELTEDQVSDEVVAAGLKGDLIPRIPEVTFNAAVQYDYALAGSDTWTGWLRGEYSYKGSSRTELRPNSINDREQHSFSLVNLRAGFRNEDLDGDITLFVENVFDVQGDVLIGVGNGEPTYKITNRPRTIGLQLNKHF